MESGLCTETACTVFKVAPWKVSFKFKPGSAKIENSSFKIVNITDTPQVVTLELPLSEYFFVAPFHGKGYVYPSKAVKVLVSLKSALEPRIYYDCVQVKCSRLCSTSISLEAIPRKKLLKHIPRYINFGHVPIGQTRIKKLLLYPSKIDTPFVFIVHKLNHDLSISPKRGVIRSNPVEISIEYKPTAYVTLSADVALYLPSVIYNPYVLSITAFTEPGFVRTKLMNQPSEDAMVVNPLKLKPLTHPSWMLKPTKFIIPKKTLPIWSQHKTNKLLYKQIKSKRSSFELLGPLGRYIDEEEEIAKINERGFFEGVSLTYRNNCLAFYHTKPKLREMETPAVDREVMWTHYLSQYEVPTYNNGGEPLYIRQRTVRRADLETAVYKFTDRLPNAWFPRYVTMSKFIEAGRRIIHKNRLMKVLKRFKELTKENVTQYETMPVDLF